jgi:hypothetical protein
LSSFLQSHLNPIRKILQRIGKIQLRLSFPFIGIATTVSRRLLKRKRNLDVPLLA